MTPLATLGSCKQSNTFPSASPDAACPMTLVNALGIPILHDQIYPELQPALPPEVAPDFSQPLQLLARMLAFTDPITGEERTFESPCRLSLDIIDTLPD